MERAQARKRIDKLGEEIVQDLNCYAYTAVRPDGTPDRSPPNRQLLSRHARNVCL